MDQGRSTAAADELFQRLDALERRTHELESLLKAKDQLVAEKDAIIAAQRAQIESLQAALDRAQEQLTLLKKALFGPRRERYVPSPDQKLLFETEALTAAPTESTTTPPAQDVPQKQARKPRREFVIPDFLPVRREEHRLPAEQCPCGHCGQDRVVICTRLLGARAALL